LRQVLPRLCFGYHWSGYQSIAQYLLLLSPSQPPSKMLLLMFGFVCPACLPASLLLYPSFSSL
jgi:hypothetical protein